MPPADGGAAGRAGVAATKGADDGAGRASARRSDRTVGIRLPAVLLLVVAGVVAPLFVRGRVTAPVVGGTPADEVQLGTAVAASLAASAVAVLCAGPLAAEVDSVAALAIVTFCTALLFLASEHGPLVMHTANGRDYVLHPNLVAQGFRSEL